MTELEPVLEKPQQRLPDRPELEKLLEDPCDGFLDSVVWIFFESRVSRLEIADGSQHQQLASSRLLPSGFQRTLPEKVKLILAQAPFEAQKESIVSSSRIVDRRR